MLRNWGHLGQFCALVGGVGIGVGGGQAGRQPAHAAEQPFVEVGAENRHELPPTDALAQGGPLLERVAAGEPRLVPQPAVLEPVVQRGHPEVRLVAHGPAGQRERVLDLTEPQDLSEQPRHAPLHRLHGDLRLHRQDRRHAGVGQQRGQRGGGDRLLGRPRGVGPPGALARGEDHQPRHHRQLAEPNRELLAGDPRQSAVVALKEQERPLVGQDPVAHEVEDIDVGPQRVDQAVHRERLGDAEDRDGHPGQRLASACDLLIDRDRGESVSVEIRRRRDGDHGPQRGPRAQADPPEVRAAHEAGQQHPLRGRQRRVGLRVAQQLPAEVVQPRRARIDGDADPQGPPAALEQRAGLAVQPRHARVGEQPRRERPAVGDRVELQAPQFLERERRDAADRRDLGAALRIRQAQLDLAGAASRLAEPDLQLTDPTFVGHT
jgi:hypothetical protein